MEASYIRKKNLMKLFTFLLLFIGLSISLMAQPYLNRDQSITVSDDGSDLSLAWAGGLNNPQFSSIDFNQDGINDLFVFDKSGNVILPMIKDGATNEIAYYYDPNYTPKFPEIHDWALLRDFNCDGYPDIFSFSDFGPGAMVYLNNGQSGSNWFSIADSLLYTYYEIGSSSGDVNIFISSIDLPAIHDVDDDGDLDIFTFQLQGSKVEFHKNFSQENDNECGLDYELKNRCWGYFAEDTDSEEILLGQNCVNVVNPQIGGPAHHTGSTLLMLDINDDGYDDLVMGDVSYSSLTTVVNGGPNALGLDSITSVNYFFPNTSTELILHTFPASFYLDINNDGINDFIAAPNAQYTSDNVNAVRLYLNNGTNNAPELEWVQNDFLQGEMIDVGEGAYPIFVDVNQDGLMDLLVGNRKKISDSLSNSSITYFENIGTSTNPSFELENDNMFNLSAIGVGEALYPSFLDLNGDNALDLILGNLEGELYYLLNSASENEAFDFPGPAFPLLDNTDEAIDVGQLAKPTFFDLNEDGLSDLIVGERSGRLSYFENTGTPSNADFTLITDTLGGVRSPGFLLNTGYSSPLFFNEDDEIFLVLGSETGEIQYYDNISGNLSGTFAQTAGPASDLFEGKRTSVARYDLNNDGLADMIIGNYRGGISYFKGDLSSGIQDPIKKKTYSIYPNPSSSSLTISFDKTQSYDIRIFNQIGQLIKSFATVNQTKFLIDVQDFPNGQYIIQIENKDERFVEKLIILH